VNLDGWMPDQVAAYYLGRATQRADDDSAQWERAEQLRELLDVKPIGWHNGRLRALDAAERAGEAAYAAERDRQGLVPYQRHAGLLEMAS